MPHFVTHLEGAIDGTSIPFGTLQNLHAGRPIVVKYELDAIRKSVTPADIVKRNPSALGYLSQEPNDKAVRVVLVLKDVR